MKLGHPEFQKKYYNMLVINYLKKLTFLNAEVRKGITHSPFFKTEYDLFFLVKCIFWALISIENKTNLTSALGHPN